MQKVNRKSSEKCNEICFFIEMYMNANAGKRK